MSELALPEGWVKAELSALSEFINGKAFKSSEWEDQGLPIIRIQNLNKTQATFNYMSTEVEDKYKVFNGDLLFAWSASIDCYIWNRGDAILNQHIFNVKPFEGVDLKFFFYALKKLIYQIHSHTHGTGMVHITKGNLLKLEIGLPSLYEQKKLAELLDTYLTTVYQIQARLDAIPKLIEKFRHSVLNDAVTGKLTEEWRLKKGLKVIDWRDIVLSDVIEKTMYGTSKKSSKEGDVPVLRMGNLQSGEIDWNNLVYTSDPVEIDKFDLKSGDLLFNRTNSPELVGKTSIYRGGRKAIFAGYLIKLRPLDTADSDFLNYHLNSTVAKNYCYKVKSDGVSQSNINAKKISAYPLELPSILEQKEIVKQINQLFAHADQIEKSVATAKARVDHLTQSILHQAFTGNLTAEWREQNPELISGDNSAEALLARIKAEKKKTSKV